MENTAGSPNRELRPSDRGTFLLTLESVYKCPKMSKTFKKCRSVFEQVQKHPKMSLAGVAGAAIGAIREAFK